MTTPKPMKIKRFKQLLPEILRLCETYTHQGVIDVLKEKYDFEIDLGTFRVYISRYKSERKGGDKKPIVNNNPDLKIKENSDLGSLSVEPKTTIKTPVKNNLTDKSQDDVLLDRLDKNSFGLHSNPNKLKKVKSLFVNIVVINFGGYAGKTIVSKYLLQPRLPNSVVIETENYMKSKGLKFVDIYKILERQDGKSYIIDVGASNAKIFFEEMAKFKDVLELLDYFIIPVVPLSNEQLKDTLGTMRKLLQLGVKKEKIRLVFNNIPYLDELHIHTGNISEFMKDLKMFVPTTAICTSDIFPMLSTSGKTMDDVLKIDVKENRSKIAALREKISKTKNADEIQEYENEIDLLASLNAAYNLARTSKVNLDEVFADLKLV